MSATHMSPEEVDKADSLQKGGETPQQILAKLQAARAKKGRSGPSSSGVYRFLSGETYKRGVAEKRGRRSRLPPRLVQTANAERRKLIKKANNDYLVVWADIHKATKKVLRERGVLNRRVKMPSADWLARLIRASTAVRARPGKRRISRTREHQKARAAKAAVWRKYPQSFWEEEIHGYIDNKKFVRANTARAKKLMRASKVHHHLRTPAEGREPGFVLPKKDRMLIGVPSIDVTAAVAKDRIFFWHINRGKWNGQKAAEMYEKLGEALRKTWGHKRNYRVVEDGDTKGYQSSKGKAAKREQKITSWTLPPRSPGWMPLDFCLWDEIEDRVLADTKNENETKKSYEDRLRRTALNLPKHIVKNCLSKMRENIQATYDSEGKNTKSMIE